MAGTSRYSSYKKYTQSTEVSYAKHTSQSSYTRETATEYRSSKGVSSRTKEIVSGSDVRSLPVYIAIQEFVPEKGDKDAVPLDQGQIVEVLDSRNSSSWLVRTKSKPPVTGWVPGSFFEAPTDYYKHRRETREIAGVDLKMTKQEESLKKRDIVFQDLMRSEEEFVSQLRHVIDNYVVILDEQSTPQNMRYLRDQLFLNIKDLYNFHANVLLKGLQYYSDNPGKVGQTFVRLERDFDHHVRYCRDQPDAIKLLDDPKVKEFFAKIAEKADPSGKSLLDYLKLPIDRLEQYQLTIKELIKYTARAELETKSLQRALEMMLSIPQRANDLAFIRNIHDFPGDTVKLGRLLRHDTFRVFEGDSEEAQLLYLFLFRTKLVLTTIKNSEDPDELPEFHHVNTIRLDKYDMKENQEDKTITLHPTDATQKSYRLVPLDTQNNEFVIQAWAKDIVEAKEGVAGEEDETETMTEFADMSDVRSEFSEYSSHSRKSSIALGDEGGPPRKRQAKSPPVISPSASSQSLYSSTMDLTAGTSGTLEMQGTRVTRTQYGFRTLQESSAKMCLKVTGFPLPVITWFKDGEQLFEDERHSFYADDDGFFSMTIDPVLVEDTGRYTCVATNEYGQATTSAFFRVVKVEHEPAAPKFVTQLVDKNVSEGTSVQFTCDVEGWPEPDIIWLLDGQMIHPSHDFKIEYDGQKASLEIRDAQPEDSGLYSIKITNEYGTEESVAELKVEEDLEKRKVPPEFQQCISDTIVDEGATVKFKVVATGDPPPEVSWSVNGTPLTKADNINFIAEDGIFIVTISNVTTHFDGEVLCRAVNRLGEVSCTARLTVNAPSGEPPTLSCQLKDALVAVGESAKFEVSYSTEPTEPTVTWLLNDTVVKPSDNFKITSISKGQQSFEILKSLQDLAGTVTVRVENEFGEVTSTAHFGVNPKKYGQSKPMFQSKLSPLTAVEGEQLRAKVLVSGDPVPQVKWYINNRMVVQTEDVEMIAEDGVYIMSINGATPDMAGELKCTAFNKMGEVSCTAPVTIEKGKIPVEFEQFLSDTTCHEGDTLKLKAVLLGEPSPDVTWYINKKKLEESQNIRIFNDAGAYVVVITNITCEYSGEVLCRAVNEFGEATSSAHLTVLPRGIPPDFTEWLSNAAVKNEEKVTMKVIFTGDPVPKITWMLHGKELTNNEKFAIVITSDTSTLTINKFAADMVGEIMCKAENDAGEVSCTAQMSLATAKLEVSEHSELEAVAISVEEDADAATDTALSIADDNEIPMDLDVEPSEITRTPSPSKHLKFITKIKDVRVKKGQKAVFECEVPESKGFVVKWLKDGKEIELIARIRVVSRPTDNNNQQIQLVIDNVEVDDSGKITCVISNDYGTEQCSAELKIEDVPKEIAPEFVTAVQSCTVVEGQTATLECKVTGHPSPVVQWYKGKEPVKPTKQVKVESSDDGTQRLIISSTTTTDVGEYRCEVKNVAGTASSKGTLTVEKAKVAETPKSEEIAPEFVVSLHYDEVKVGETAILECKVTGTPAPAVQWFKGGKEVKADKRHKIESLPDGTQKLTVMETTEADKCEFKVEAVNKAGKAVEQKALVLKAAKVAEVAKVEEVAPEFVTSLHYDEVKIGETAVLECKVTGLPAPAVQWFKGGKEIKPDKRHKIETLSDGTQKLTIIETTEADKCEVKVEAVNKAGKAYEQKTLVLQAAKVAEVPKPEEVAPEFVTSLHYDEVKVGETAVLECQVAGVPAPVVQWFMAGKEVKADKRHKIETLEDGTQRLSILETTESDRCEIKVEATNAVGTAVEQKPLVLKVAKVVEIPKELAPEFVTSLHYDEVKVGETAVLECKVIGTPMPVVHWYQAGKEVKADKRHKIETLDDGTQKLSILDTVESDRCEIKVEAVNAVGTAVEEKTLVLQAAKLAEVKETQVAPEFVTALHYDDVKVGEVATFECKVVGTPAPLVQWFKGTQEIKVDKTHQIESLPDGTQKLKIVGVSEKDKGEYRAEAVNPAGKATTKQLLEIKVAKKVEEPKPVESAPEFLEPLHYDKAVVGETVTLECKVASTTTSPLIHWYKGEEEIKPDKQHKVEELKDGTLRLTIVEAKESDVGDYRCEVANTIGSAKTETLLELKSAKVEKLVAQTEVAPEFKIPLQQCTADEGSTAVLECAVVGTPLPQVRWLKDDKPVVEDKSIKIESLPDGTQRLTIKEATAESVGEYKCEAVNPMGKVSSEAPLKVNVESMVEAAATDMVAPEFCEVLHSVRAEEGETAILQCRVTGTPVPNVRWYRGGELVDPESDPNVRTETVESEGLQRLIIQYAKLDYIGEYRCEAANPLGTAWTEAPLMVAKGRSLSEQSELAPDFFEPLHTCMAEEGDERVTLQCRVVGLPPPTVSWFKDGEAIPEESEHYEMRSEPDGLQQLIIQRAELEDIGEYRCEAANIFGLTWSDATLSVQAANQMDIDHMNESAPDFVETLRICRASETDTQLQLECKVVGTPAPNVVWLKDGQKIEESPEVTVESLADGTQRLIIQNASEASLGDYRCEATNEMGTVCSDTALLNVAQRSEIPHADEVAPEFTRELQQNKVEEGETAAFECQIVGHPVPEVKWFKDGKELKPSEHIEIVSEPNGTQKLVVHEAKAEDQGNYKCEVTNAAGCMSSKAPLTVHVAEEMEIDLQEEVAPAFVEQLKECKAAPGQTLVLECAVSGLPLPQVQWFKDGKEIVPSDAMIIESYPDGRQKLTIAETTDLTHGKYECVAVNPAGKAASAAPVTEEKPKAKVVKPEFKQGLKAAGVKQGETVSLACQVKLAPKDKLPKVSWTKDGLPVDSSDRVSLQANADGSCSLTIAQSLPTDAGVYACVLTNDGGTVKSEAAVTVEKAPAMEAPEFAKKLSNVEVAEGSEIRLQAIVSGKPFPSIVWHKDGKAMDISGRIRVEKDEDTGIVKMIISSATVADEGSYRLTVKNDEGSVSCKADVKVEALTEQPMEVEESAALTIAPTFNRKAADAFVTEGESFELSCNVSGAPFPDVKWYKGGTLVEASDTVHIQTNVDGSGECRLIIDSANLSHSDHFTCTLKNPAGANESCCEVSVESASLRLKQNEQGEQVKEDEVTLSFTRKLSDQKVPLGVKVILEVEVNAKPRIVKWYKDGKDIHSGGGINIVKAEETVYQLIIDSSKKGDEGVYSVEVSNTSGAVTSEGSLSVEKTLFLFTKPLEDTTADEGASASFIVETTGKPKSIKWYKNGKELKTSKKVKQEKLSDTQFKLTIEDTTKDDSASYKVELDSAEGTLSGEASLTVKQKEKPKGPPEVTLSFKRQLQSQTAKTAEKIVFEVEVNAKPKSVKWYKAGKEVQTSQHIVLEAISDTVYRLTLLSTTADDMDEYKIEVSNTSGSVTSSGRLTIERELVPELKLLKQLEDKTVKAGEKVVFEVEVDGKPDSIIWYKNGKELKATEKIRMENPRSFAYTLTLDDVSNDDAAVYKVVLSNEEHTVDTNASLSIRRDSKDISAAEPEDVALSFTKKIQNTKVIEGVKAYLDASVNAKPKSVKWYKNGKELTASDRVKIERVKDTSFQLCIVSTSKETDEAEYKIEVSNSKGTISSTARISVEGEAPRLIKGLFDQTVAHESQVILEVETEGKIKAVKWYLNNKEITVSDKVKINKVGNNVYQLILSDVDKANDGEYKAEAVNDFGSSSSKARLRVTGKPPRFVKELQSQTVEEGSQAVLQAEIQGKPSSVKWYKNGREISAGKKFSINKADGNLYELIIADCTKAETEATYKVEATNDFGTSDSQASLTVKLPPPPAPKKKEVEEVTVAAKFILPLNKVQSVSPSESISLSCRAKGQPFPEIAWLKDGVELESSERVKLSLDAAGYCRLTIASSTESDAGSYTCIAQNVAGSDKTDCTLEITAAPITREESHETLEFVKPLKNKMCLQDEDLVLEVRVIGKPMPEMVWYKNDEEIKPSARVIGQIEVLGNEITFKLTLKAVELTDAGSYKCVATNVFESISTEGTVTVETKPAEAASVPKFVIPLRDLTATEGGSIELDIKVRGVPTPDLKWVKDGAPLEFDDRILLEDMGDNRWKVTINDVRATDKGSYQCVATNEQGSDECTCEMTVRPSKDKRKAVEENFAPRFNVPLHDRSLPEHSQMSVECHVDAKPYADVSWFKDGESVASSDKYEIEYSKVDGKCRLLIKDFSGTDEGIYKCTAKNELGEASTKATLKVSSFAVEEKEKIRQFAPRFTQDLSDLTVKELVSATLECAVDAKPEADITWFKDGIPVRPSDNIRIEAENGRFRLIIAQVKSSDEGAYRCLATNIIGSTNSAAYLTVGREKQERKPGGEAPSFLLPLRDATVDSGSSLTLKCSIAGDPAPEVKWFKDGMPIKASHRCIFQATADGSYSLTVKDAVASDAGLYRCVAGNSLGSANTVGNVRVEAPIEKRKVTISQGEAPKFAVGLEDWSCVEGSAVEFDCKVTGQPTPNLKWSKDGVPLKTDHRISIESAGDDRYLLKVKDVRQSDEGVYRCVAANDSGSATTKAQLRVSSGTKAASPMPGTDLSMPRCVVPLSDTRLQAGSPLKLECKVASQPEPEFEWYKDGEKLVGNNRVHIDVLNDGTSRLWIEKALTSDDGMYRCVAKNQSGAASSKATVSVRPGIQTEEIRMEDLEKQKAPKFVIPLDPQASRVGFSVTLTCKVIGSPTPMVKWFKDGNRLYPFGNRDIQQQPDGTCTLTISKLTHADGGCYRCVADNDHGTASTRAEVNVEGKEPKVKKSLEEHLVDGKAPGFLKPLTVVRVTEGGKARFQCLPYGKPFPAIQWMKDGVDIRGSDRVIIDSLPDGTQQLLITDAYNSDDGFYRCVASNEFGTSSTKAELTVEADKTKKKAGLGQLTEEEANLPQKPRFRQGLRNITATAGTAVEFECFAAGFPRPTARWFKGDQELTLDDRALLWADDRGFHRLVILNCQDDDVADYRIEISNPHGTATSDGSLSLLKERFVMDSEMANGRFANGEAGEGLQRGPGFLKQLRNRHVFAGTPAIFDCVVCGVPTADVEWFHKGERVIPSDRIKIQTTGGNSHALVILKSTPDDQGEYTCTAKNAIGTASSTAYLEVSVPFEKTTPFDLPREVFNGPVDEYLFKRSLYSGIPGPPNRGPFIAEVTGHYLTLSWIPTKREPPRYPQVTYIVEMRELPDKDWYLVDYNIPQPCCKVRNLELGKSYQFRVRAENLYGISDPSPSSPPSMLMAPPKPVLDKRKRPIPIMDPYAQSALDKAHGDIYAAAPWFAPRDTDKVFCGEHDTLEIVFWVYGFPDPEIKWYFRGWEVDPVKNPRVRVGIFHGNETVLTISDFCKEDIGQYQCRAVNKNGEAQQNIFVEAAELPSFIQPLENKIVTTDKMVKLDCRIEGTPYPDVKWFKDWYPIAESSRVKINKESPYLCSLMISNPMLADTGIYTCTATNEAGKVSSTATVTVEAEPLDYEVEVPRRKVGFKPKRVREFYRIEEEISKDAHSVVHRVVELVTGRPFLAKFVRREFKRELQYQMGLWNYFNHPNIPILYDACEDGDTCCLIYESTSGGGLLDRMTSVEGIRESQIAFFMRQLMQALEHLHSKNVVHLDLKPENIMLSDSSKDQIKLVDFGLSRKLRRDRDTYGTLGAPEFVPPEIVLQRPVSLASDMWSAGVLAYVLLSGVSPFLGDSDSDTLKNIIHMKFSLDIDQFSNVSDNAKDFIQKLLVLNPSDRLSVNQALQHPWLQLSDKEGPGELLDTKFLKEFKYRHQWVERRIFVQTSPDEEKLLCKSPRSTLEWMEPLYFPPPVSEISSGRDPAKDAGGQKDRRSDKGQPGGNGTDPNLYLAQSKRRPIEEELANRILSDISEEGSVVSEDEFGRKVIKSSRERLLDEDLDMEDVNEGEKTPTQEEIEQKSAARRAASTHQPSTPLHSEASAHANGGIVAPMPIVSHADEEAEEMIHSKLARPLTISISKGKGITLEKTSPGAREVEISTVIKSRSGSQLNSPMSPHPSPGVKPESTEKKSDVEDIPAVKRLRMEPKPPQPAEDDFDSLMAEVNQVKRDVASRFKELEENKTRKFTEIDKDDSIDFQQYRKDHERGPKAPTVSDDSEYKYLSYEDYEWDSEYQTGPETYLIQLRDPDLAGRIRDYRRHLYGGDSMADIIGRSCNEYKNKDITVRERRHFTDMVKTDLDLQSRVASLSKETSTAPTGAIRRATKSQMPLPPKQPTLVNADGTHKPIFQCRLKDVAFMERGAATFQAVVIGNPTPTLKWFRNDGLITEGGRHEFKYENNRATLTVNPAYATDAGIYKCLATNSLGESFTCAKLRHGVEVVLDEHLHSDLPDRTSRPDVELASDTEVFLTWQPPANLLGLEILGYKLEFKRTSDGDWSAPWLPVSSNIEGECVVVKHMEPLLVYQFRITARNCFGWGEPSFGSRMIQTHQKGAPKLNIEALKDDYHLTIANIPHGGVLGEIPEDTEASPCPSDELTEKLPTPDLQLNTLENPANRYQLESEIYRGRFCLIRNAVDTKSEQSAHCAAKILLAAPDYREAAIHEYEILREVQHENVVTLLKAYLREDFCLLFLEKLDGDILDRFTYADYYTEEVVTRVVGQLLLAIQWIHFKQIFYLDLQPDNILFTSRRSWNVKLIDMGSAVRLNRDGETKVTPLSAPDYCAPEVLASHPIHTTTDIWGVGVIAFLLLSGFHPFASDEDTEEEVIKHITQSKLDLNLVYTNASEEALKFLVWALKKPLLNRMTTEEGLRHRWMQPGDALVRRRENVKFSSNRLRAFKKIYRQRRLAICTSNNQLLSVYGANQ